MCDVIESDIGKEYVDMSWALLKDRTKVMLVGCLDLVNYFSQKLRTHWEIISLKLTKTSPWLISFPVASLTQDKNLQWAVES